MLPKLLMRGHFYEFNRMAPRREIGDWIPRNKALERIRRKLDVYTPAQSDAMSLAKDARKGKADWEGSHVPSKKTDWDYGLPTNQRFPHFHPGGDHDNLGHVFYGGRGTRVDENRR